MEAASSVNRQVWDRQTTTSIVLYWSLKSQASPDSGEWGKGSLLCRETDMAIPGGKEFMIASWRQLSHHSTSLKILFSVFRGIICTCIYVSYPLLDYVFSVGGSGGWFIFVFLAPDLLFHTSQISNAPDVNRITWQYSQKIHAKMKAQLNVTIIE